MLRLAVLCLMACTITLFGTVGLAGAATNYYTSTTAGTTGTNPFSVAIGDLNGDGEPDLATANRGSATVTVITRNAAGTGWDDPVSAGSTGTDPFSVAIGDLNGDGKPDLATANFNSSTVTVITRNAAGTGWDDPVSVAVSPGSGPDSVAIGDLNGDGKPDLATANRFSSTVTVITRNAAGTGWDAPVSAGSTGTDPRSGAIGDLNGDGKPDLATANAGSNSVTVITRNAAGTGWDAPTNAGTTGLGTVSVAIGDLSGDGKPDLATANYTSSTVTVITRNEAGTGWDAPTNAGSTGTNPISVAIGDVNGDGRPDLATANAGAGSVTVLLAGYDGIAPVTTDSVDASWHSSAVSVTLSASDTGGSGVDKTYYTTGASPVTPTTSSTLYDSAAKPTLTNGQRISYFTVDGAGNAETVKTSSAAKVDGGVPDTTITGAPADPGSDPRPLIVFSSTATAATFECSLDGGAFTACTSPFQPALALVDGPHFFAVRAISQVGIKDPTPAQVAFVVAKPPIVTITTPVEGATYDLASTVRTSKSCVDDDGHGRPGRNSNSCVETGASPAGYVDTGTVGNHEYSVTATSRDGVTSTRVVHYKVDYAVLTAQIAAPSLTPVINEAAQFTVNVSGGRAPYTYQWSGTDPNAAGQTPSGNDSTLWFAFGALGQRSVNVRVTDSQSPPRVVDATRTVTVERTCVRSVDIGVGVITADCMKPTDASTDADPILRATGNIKVNGQVIVGSTIEVKPGTVTRPTTITSAAATVPVRGVNVQQGALSWSIPYVFKAPPPRNGDPPVVRNYGEVVITSVASPPSPGAKLLGLAMAAGGKWYAGKDRTGVGTTGPPYIRFAANLVLPTFNVTTTVSVRTDATGTTIPSAFAQVTDAKLGTVTVKKLCFSFVAAGTDDEDGLPADAARRCGVFDGPDGNPYVECATRTDVDRWDGTAELELPFDALGGVHLSGGISGGKLSYLAAAADFGHSITLSEETAWLTQMRVGVCVQPAPVKVRGGATIGMVPDPRDPENAELMHVNGDFLYEDNYTDAQGVAHPWKATINGSVDAYGEDIGSGWLSIGGNKVAAMHLETDRSYAGGLITYGGSVDGAMSFSTGRFNVEGEVHACMASVLCGNAEALISNEGLSACVTVIPRINFGFFSTPALKSGFGFRWANQQVSIMWAGCSIGSWRVAVSRATMRSARAQNAAPSITVGKDEQIRTIRLLGGSEGAPDVIVRGPNGELLQIPAGQNAAGSLGKNVMVRNTAGHETIIQLIKPAPGKWTFTPVAESAPIVRVDEAPVLAEPAVTGKLAALPGGRQRLTSTYPSQKGLVVSIEEIAADNTSQKVLATVKPCGHATCTATRDFSPALGKGGKRNIVATATRDGHLVNRTVLASYTAPGTRAGQAGKPGLTRKAKNVRVCWTGATGAVSYDVSVQERVQAGGTAGYDMLKTVNAECATFPAPTPGAKLAVQVTPNDAIGGRGTVSSALLAVPTPAKPARVRGMRVHRLTSGLLLITWKPTTKVGSQFGVVVRHGRSVRQGVVSSQCKGMVIHATPGKYVHVTVAALTNEGVAGPSTTADVVAGRLGAAAAGRLSPPVRGVRCQLTR